MQELKAPVLFLIYNRPNLTKKVFEAIRKARPKKLFISADGPKKAIKKDIEQCQKTREIVKQVNWDCALKINFRKNNLGLKLAISSAIDWFFKHVKEGIILEDDCLPNQSFFWFCQELLEKYRHDERLMQISGSNYLFGKKIGNASYYFSKLNDIWGWATWRRAWQKNNPLMPNYLQFKKTNQLANYLSDKKMQTWLKQYFDKAYQQRKSHKGIWSSSWTYAVCVNNGLTIVPACNLVANIGINKGTHINKSFRLYSWVKNKEMKKIIHPKYILPDNEADKIRFKIIKRTDPYFSKKHQIKRLINRIIIKIKRYGNLLQ